MNNFKICFIFPCFCDMCFLYCHWLITNCHKTAWKSRHVSHLFPLLLRMYVRKEGLLVVMSYFYWHWNRQNSSKRYISKISLTWCWMCQRLYLQRHSKSLKDNSNSLFQPKLYFPVFPALTFLFLKSFFGNYSSVELGAWDC